MGIGTLFGYLIGRRDAILQIASSRHSLWIGFLFVLSAGFARNYDNTDLIHEWWHLLLPLGASLVSSFLLFAFAFHTPVHPSQRPTFGSGYRAFLSLFWMTAPLAWLYAIPYERFLTELGATKANLATLGLVAVWRVVLIVRVLVVQMNYRLSKALFTVMTYASGVAVFFSCMLMPGALLGGMGGIRSQGTEVEQLVRNVTALVMQLLVICLLVSYFLMGWSTCSQGEGRWNFPDSELSAPPKRLFWSLAFASLGIWLVILPFTQPEQQLRWRVEQAIKEEEFGFALKEMSAYNPEDFPPLWSPPPRKVYPVVSKELIGILKQFPEVKPAPWVRQVYLDKLRNFLCETEFIIDLQGDQLAEVLVELPEGKVILQEATQVNNHESAKVSFKYLNLRVKELEKEKNSGNTLQSK